MTDEFRNNCREIEMVTEEVMIEEQRDGKN
jgi:hypothetical protein